MKILAMPELPIETKRLVNEGSWGLYEYGDEDYLLVTSAYCECCNPREQKFYKLSSSGKFLGEGTKADFLRSAKDHVRFDLLEDPAEETLREFLKKLF